MATIYGTLPSSKIYHAERGNAPWGAASDDDLNSALLRASVYIDGRYRQKLSTGLWISLFSGSKVGGRAQEREWPRIDAKDYQGFDIDSGSVPTEVEHATYEAALRELAAPGSLSPDFSFSSIVKRNKVDVIEQEFFRPDNLGEGNRPILPLIDEIIAPVLTKRTLVHNILTV